MSDRSMKEDFEAGRLAVERISSRMIPVLLEQTDRSLLRRHIDPTLDRINERIAEGWKITKLESVVPVDSSDDDETGGGLMIMVWMRRDE